MALLAAHAWPVSAPWRYVARVGLRRPVAPFLEAMDFAADSVSGEVGNRGLGRWQVKRLAQDARGIPRRRSIGEVPALAFMRRRAAFVPHARSPRTCQQLAPDS
jgi:hypothetical protein